MTFFSRPFANLYRKSGKSRMFQAKITRLSDSRTHLTPVLPEAPMIATFMVLISIISFNFFWAA